MPWGPPVPVVCSVQPATATSATAAAAAAPPFRRIGAPLPLLSALLFTLVADTSSAPARPDRAW
ncbi:hypothetical protein GCM10020295_49690 [Streptomyces cinereospinus]